MKKQRAETSMFLSSIVGSGRGGGVGRCCTWDDTKVDELCCLGVVSAVWSTNDVTGRREGGLLRSELSRSIDRSRESFLAVHAES